MFSITKRHSLLFVCFLIEIGQVHLRGVTIYFYFTFFVLKKLFGATMKRLKRIKLEFSAALQLLLRCVGFIIIIIIAVDST